MDWAHSSDTVIKAYTEFVRKESFPEGEVRAYLKEATQLECVNDYGSKMSRCYLETANGPTVLESTELYEDYYGNHTREYYRTMIQEIWINKSLNVLSAL